MDAETRTWLHKQLDYEDLMDRLRAEHDAELEAERTARKVAALTCRHEEEGPCRFCDECSENAS